MDTFLLLSFLIVCLLLIVVVLLQKGRGGGLGSAFGGGSAGSAFGTRTGDVFTWVTIVLTALFLLLAIVATLAVRPPTMQVDMPVFSPSVWPEKQKTDEIKVNMEVATKGAIIRYTIDGAEPTEKSLRYSRTAIPVRLDQILRAKAFRAGFEPSETLTVTYARPKPAPQPVPQPAVQPDTQPATQPAGTVGAEKDKNK